MTSRAARPVLDLAFPTRAVVAALSALVVAACGGGSDSSPGTPPDTTPPTVTIGDDTTAAVAIAPVTFTFTFSEDVGTSFTAADVALTGGTKGALTRASSTVYRLVTTPDPDAVGTLTVSVPVAAFTDLAGNANGLAATASQAYDTRTPVTLTQMTLPVTFDVATVDYGLVGFEGAEDSSIVLDPAGSTTNHVARIVRSATAQAWAGTTITKADQLGFATALPFTEADTRMTVRIWSPAAGLTIRLKAESHADANVYVQTDATTTTQDAWETLTFDFGNAVGAALDVAKSYDKVTVFPDFGRAGGVAGAETFYFDDVVFVGGGGITGPFAFATVDFDRAGVTYALAGFGGAEDSTVVLDPGGSTTNHVARVLKATGAQTWAGTTASTHSGASVGKIPFDASNTRMTVRFWSPDTGIKVRLKVEDHTQGAISCETEATTTVAGGWETLTFDFASPASGTAALNVASTYDKVSVFPDFGVAGAGKVYYFDEIVFLGGGGLPVIAAPTTTPPIPPTPVTTTISFYSSVTGGYNGTAYDESGRIDRWPCAQWSSAQCAGPAMIDPGLGTTAAPLKFVFTHGSGEVAGLEFIGAAGVNEIDAIALGLTALHLDVWTPDLTALNLQLVDFGADGQWSGTYPDLIGIAPLHAGSSPSLATGAWVSYDLPLSTGFWDAGGLPNKNHLAQLLFVGPNGGTLYVDNLYFH